MGDSVHCHCAGGPPRARAGDVTSPHTDWPSTAKARIPKPGRAKAGQDFWWTVQVPHDQHSGQCLLSPEAFNGHQRNETGGSRGHRATGVAIEVLAGCPGHSKTSFSFSASCLNLRLPTAFIPRARHSAKCLPCINCLFNTYSRPMK